MVPATGSQQGASQLRKLDSSVKPPSPAVLEALSADDARLLRRRLAETAECVYNARFEEADIEQTLLAPLSEPANRAAGEIDPSNDDSGVDLLSSGRAVSFTTEQEQHLFLRLNYCRYRQMQVVERFAGKRLSADGVAEFLRWERLSARTREDIVRVNMPLVLAMAKRTRICTVDFSDLISEGNLALLRAVDKFDCSRGFKFSTYACRAILKSFSRVATRTSRYRGHFPTEFDPALEKSDHVEVRRLNVEDDCVHELKHILGDNLARLTEVEAQVIHARFALDAACQDVNGNGRRPKTLEQVGEMIGVTKERVRQIQNKALGKIRAALEDGILAT
jgi:RNA polymerase sigma factor (sigma-70 family)